MKTFPEINAYLKEELVTAMGCTEPIAVAYAVAVATQHLGEKPQSLKVIVSVSLLKNAAGVVIPNSGNRKGTHVAAILGALCGDANLGLEVIAHVSPKELNAILPYFDDKNFCQISTELTPTRVYIKVIAHSPNHKVELELKHTHTGITSIVKDGVSILNEQELSTPSQEEEDLGLSIDLILDYIEDPLAQEIFPFIQSQITNNLQIAEHGLTCECTSAGLNVGKILLQRAHPDDVLAKAKAYTAASSDARMGGCAMPVGTVCGSGNQGMTASVPLSILAQKLESSEEECYKSVLLADLVASHIKSSMGRLSPFCGVVTAGVGVCAGIVYLHNGTHTQIKHAINNMLGNISGMFCDGAKSTCAAKCASSVDAAFQAAWLALDDHHIEGQEGVIDGEDVEVTIKNIIEIATLGMSSVDKVICDIMTR